MGLSRPGEDLGQGEQTHNDPKTDLSLLPKIHTTSPRLGPAEHHPRGPLLPPSNTFPSLLLTHLLRIQTQPAGQWLPLDGVWGLVTPPSTQNLRERGFSASPRAAQLKAVVRAQRDSEVLVQGLWHVWAAGRAGGQQGWGGRKGRGRGGMREWDEPSGTPNCAAAAQRRAQPAHPTQPQKLPHPSPRRCLPETDVTAHPKNISRTLPQTLSAPGSTPPCSCPPRNCHTRTCGDFNTPTIKIPSHPGRN